MTPLTIDLKSFSDLEKRMYGTLLIGNGFSVGISPKFSYRSLYDAGVKLGTIGASEQALFKSFDTTDFEYLLRKLAQAATVNKILGIDHITPTGKYKTVREALVRSVHEVHPRFGDLNYSWIEQCAEFMHGFDSIFSLNYDLFPYWISGSRNFEGFTDYFWSSGLTFDPYDTDVWGRKTKLFYPHGGLFLYEDINGEISKIRQADGSNVLDDINANIAGLNVPIFVSEGTHIEKLRKIQQNSYLSFAYSRIRELSGGIIIYGTSLSQQDNHIIAALKTSRVYRIAVGIYVGTKSALDVEAEKANIQQKFGNSSIKFEFFDSATSPLNYIP